MAPQAGFEPATDRLTADCSTTELLRNAKFCTIFGVTPVPIILASFGGFVIKVGLWCYVGPMDCFPVTRYAGFSTLTVPSIKQPIDKYPF